MRGRIPLAIQVGAVAFLFAAALAALWQAGTSAVQRERRRADINDTLRGAGEALRGKAGALALVPEWPATLDEEEWSTLGGMLADAASESLQPSHAGEVTGGFFVPLGDRYLGTVGAPRRSGLPPGEADLIDALVRAALQRERVANLIGEGPGGTFALRAEPVWINGRKVAAVWLLARLEDRGSLAAALKDYRRAAGLAVGGIALALVLTLGLARTVRRQAREKEAIQADLRRSERLAALGKLLAGVAHEVRNPLAGLRSTAQLWQRGIGPDSESIRGVVAEVDRLEALVSRLLQFSRADAEKRDPGDLNEVVAEAARLAHATADGEDIRIDLDLAPSLPLAPMSPPAILQVLRNLTTNAVQAMGPRGGTLRLSTRLDPARPALEAHVADSGPGLSPDARAHLFEPFFTTKQDGTGLGLAIAREIALAHGGDLRAEAPHGHPGAAFILSIPLAAPSR